MIRSVAGEPPQAFRRRILLERAAYRMVTTRAPLIDLAVEAGYGSHEAFTRAFTRAYGVPPATWRSSPGRIRIPAPSDVHFHPPGSLRLPARDKVTAMDLMTRMVEHHIWLTGEMVRLAGRLTDEQLDQPIELDVDDDVQTIRSLLSRLIGQMGMWNAAVATRDYDWSVEEHESLASMRERLAAEGPTFLRHVRESWTTGPARRHVRRRALRAGRGVHLRRDDRPRADLRRAPPDPGRARALASTASRSSAGATRWCGWRHRRGEVQYRRIYSLTGEAPRPGPPRGSGAGRALPRGDMVKAGDSTTTAAAAGIVLLTLASGQFLMTLDSSVMNVSIAQVAEDVGTTVTGIQTAITLYTLVMATTDDHRRQGRQHHRPPARRSRSAA